MPPDKLDLREAPKAAMPRMVKPMLATAVAESFNRPGWLFEIKWDGYRAIAEVEQNKVRLYSRTQLPFERLYASIVESLKKLEHDAVLDGEIVVLDDDGKPQFQFLQNYQKSKRGRLAYYVFDLLYLDGHDLRRLPLRRRKELLAEILPPLPDIKISEHVADNGVTFFAAVAQQGLEGVIAKDGASAYHEGRRSKSWLKIKTHERQQAVICGFTEPQGNRRYFGAIILGIYKDGELRYIGHSGSGFSEKALADVHRRLQPLRQSKSPFKKPPKTNARPYWVKPELVCEVAFAGWTDDGHVRHPIFQGLREDVPASTVRREQVEPLANVVDSPPETCLQPPFSFTQKNVNVQVGGHVLQFTNLEKRFWPEDGFSKGDLVNYYREVAQFIVPYLKDRPQSLNRHPNGISGKSFFQKDVRRQPPPEWVQTVEVASDKEAKVTRFLLCQDEATLLYLANLGCIELNPWNSRVPTLENPDYLLIDLDPEDIAFDRVVETAQAVRRALDQIGVASACKTSGKRGLHVYVPLGARYTHNQAKQFGELLVHWIHRELPSTTSVLRLPQQRQQRVYLDWLQNGRGKTLAAPYSVRPYPGATVSTPLKWSEVKRGLDPAKFTIRTIPKRLQKAGDLWSLVLGAGIELYECLERLTSLLERSSRRRV